MSPKGGCISWSQTIKYCTKYNDSLAESALLVERWTIEYTVAGLLGMHSLNFYSRFLTARLVKPVLPSLRDNTGRPHLPSVRVSIELSVHPSPPGDHPTPPYPSPLSPPPFSGQLGGGGKRSVPSARSQLGAGIIRNVLAIPIGWLTIRCSLDWLR